MFSQRSVTGDGPNAVADALARAARDGRALVDLTVSNPTAVGLAYPGERIRQALGAPGVLGYRPTSFGSEAARHAIAEHWRGRGITCPPERLLLTASTSEAYSFLFKLLCDPGDEVLIPAPSYPLFEHLAKYENVNAVPYQLGYDGSWHLDFDRIGRALSPRTRAIVLVHPNNPTGSFIKSEERRRLHELGVPLVSDEVFARYPLSERSVESIGGDDAGALTFVLDGLSKSAGLPQLKLAWTGVFGPTPDVERALARLELVTDTFLSVNAAVENGIGELLAAGDEVRAAILERIRSNHAWLTAELGGGAISVLDLEGGWNATLRLPAVHTEEAWVVMAIERAGVSVQPGWFYDFAGGPHAVVSLLCEPRSFQDGIRRLGELVQGEVR